MIKYVFEKKNENIGEDVHKNETYSSPEKRQGYFTGIKFARYLKFRFLDASQLNNYYYRCYPITEMYIQ